MIDQREDSISEDPQKRANELVARIHAAGITNDEIRAKADEFHGDMEAAANFFEKELDSRDKNSLGEKQDPSILKADGGEITPKDEKEDDLSDFKPGDLVVAVDKDGKNGVFVWAKPKRIQSIVVGNDGVKYASFIDGGSHRLDLLRSRDEAINDISQAYFASDFDNFDDSADSGDSGGTDAAGSDGTDSPDGSDSGNPDGPGGPGGPDGAGPGNPDGPGEFDWRKKLRRYRELEDIIPTATGDTKTVYEQEMAVLKSELYDHVASEREADRYSGQGIFTRIDNAKETAIKNVRAFSGSRINENEILGQLNMLQGTIDGMMKEGDAGSAERTESVKRASALQFELERARKEVVDAIAAFNPLERLKRDALLALEGIDIIPPNSLIRAFSQLSPDDSQKYSPEIDIFKGEFEVLRRMHNFVVASRGKGAKEIKEAMDLFHETLVNILGDASGEEIRKMVLARYQADAEVFDAINQATTLMSEDDARKKLRNETVLGNDFRVFRDDALEAAYKAIRNPDDKSDFEDKYKVYFSDATIQAEYEALTDPAAKTAFEEGHKELKKSVLRVSGWTVGFQFKQEMKERFVKSGLKDEFLENEIFRAEFARKNGMEMVDSDSDSEKKEALTEKIKNSDEYLVRKTILEQRMAAARDFYEITVAPIVIEPIKVAPKGPSISGDKRTYLNGWNYIFAGNYANNPMIKDRFPQHMIEARGDDVNFRNQEIFGQIFKDGFYKYRDPSEVLMAMFGANNIDEFKNMPDFADKLKNNPDFVSVLKNEAYGNAAVAETNEMFGKLEKFELNPTEEGAKTLMESYFGRTADDKREFNKRVLKALMLHKINVNGVLTVNGKELSQLGKWGPRRVEDYLLKQVPAYIGKNEMNQLLKELYGGKVRRTLVSKPAEISKAWMKEVLSPKNLLWDTPLFWVKTLFEQSKDQIKKDL